MGPPPEICSYFPVLVYKQISIETALQNETGLFSFWVRAQARTLLTRKARANLRWNENPYHFEAGNYVFIIHRTEVQYMLAVSRININELISCL